MYLSRFVVWGSINNCDPLVVIDGVPTDLGTAFTEHGGCGTPGRIERRIGYQPFTVRVTQLVGDNHHSKIHMELQKWKRFKILQESSITDI